jgi:hypothetical protein
VPHVSRPDAPAPPHVEAIRDDALAAALASVVEQSQRAVRSYAQIGQGARPRQAEAGLAEAVRAGDRVFATLAAGTGRRLSAARLKQMSLRWRALREATATRPEPRIAALMDAVAGQLGALAEDAAQRLPAPSTTQRQRILLHRMAGAYLLRCWGAGEASADAMLAMRIEFGHLLDASRLEDGIDGATLRSQWGLLAGGLDRHGERCEPSDLAKVASTSDRVAQLLEAASVRNLAARHR